MYILGSYFFFLKKIKKASFKTKIFKKRLKFFEKIDNPMGFRVWFFKVSNKGKFFFIKKKNFKFKIKKNKKFYFKSANAHKKQKIRIKFWFKLKKKIKIIKENYNSKVSPTVKRKNYLYIN